MADKNQPLGDGQASSLSNLKITQRHLDHDYEIVKHNLSRGETKLLKVFSLNPKTKGRPSFQARVDDGSAKKSKEPELDIDIEGVSDADKADFKACRNGYIGHHTVRIPKPDERIFDVEIATPSFKVFKGEVFFNVDLSVRLNMEAQMTATIQATVIRAKPESKET